jgi:putative glutamine amidotransferase
MRPLIGIPCHAGAQAETERPIYYNNRSYIHAVERAGGVPILIPILDDLNGLNALLPRLDGLLLSGGIDVDPRYYREEPHPQLGRTNPQLDELELSLAHWALQEDVPTLGICRGMQLLNVALGGNIYQDLASEYSGSFKHGHWDLPRNRISHKVLVEPGSLMEKVFGTCEVPANSLHHQAVKEPGEGVYISGRSEDGVAELLEVPAHRFMLAAQCHPEELHIEHPVWSNLFSAFIRACSEPLMQRLTVVQPLGVAS